MRDRDLYAQTLGIDRPWRVRSVDLDPESEEVRIQLEHDASVELQCPQCKVAGSRHGTKERGWRHLDTCQYRTLLIAQVPRVKCSEHGVHQIAVPWAEPGSRFTALFERVVIDWLLEASLTGVARRLGLSWDQVASIQERAVRRGLARRKQEPVAELGIDETSFQRRHEYVTVAYDLVRNRVVFVGDGRKKEVLDQYFNGLSGDELDAIDYVAMDMWGTYIAAVRDALPDADSKIAFDKFHIAQHLGDAVNKVRRKEHRELVEQGDDRLKGTRYLWLQNPENMSVERYESFAELRENSLKVAQAWALKEAAMQLWHYSSRGWARRQWHQWIDWASESPQAPLRKVADMVRHHLYGVINAVVMGVTNATSESLNGKIQWLKRMARGYRNRQRFRDAIYFDLGGLDLKPAT